MIKNIDIKTDVSGKWVSIDHVNELIESIVKECASIADVAEPYKADDLIKKHFGINE